MLLHDFKKGANLILNTLWLLVIQVLLNVLEVHHCHNSVQQQALSQEVLQSKYPIQPCCKKPCARDPHSMPSSANLGRRVSDDRAHPRPGREHNGRCCDRCGDMGSQEFTVHGCAVISKRHHNSPGWTCMKPGNYKDCVQAQLVEDIVTSIEKA